MGIDLHALNFLKHARKQGPFGATITIGRQSLHVNEWTVRRVLHADAAYRNQAYCEQLLRERFGATVVDSLDNSRYERATILHDMNKPLPEDIRGRYDTVIDAGSLEHVFNAPQALTNCSLLCKAGGQILHMLPANNCCGHGFWQFSPELFFSLYTIKNGYVGTEVYLADVADTSVWYEVQRPENGIRANVYSATELYALVRTVLNDRVVSHDNVQQSDYVFEWDKALTEMQRAPAVSHSRAKALIKKVPALHHSLLFMYNQYVRSRALSKARLDRHNPSLTTRRLKAFL